MKSLLVPVLLAACADDAGFCTQIGCTDGLEVEFTKTSGTWESGEWGFEVDVDGTVQTCTVSFPFVGDTTADCDGADIWVGISGTELPEDQQAITGFGTSLVGETVFLTIRLDGDVVKYMTFEPDYQRLQPNGEGCGPVCYSATDTYTRA